MSKKHTNCRCAQVEIKKPDSVNVKQFPQGGWLIMSHDPSGMTIPVVEAARSTKAELLAFLDANLPEDVEVDA